MTHRVWGKPDRNQPAIVAALRKAGYRVQPLSAVGGGCADLLVADAATGAMYVLEVKEPGGKLTLAQVRWREEWPAQVPIVHTPEEALAAVKVTP